MRNIIAALTNRTGERLGRSGQRGASDRQSHFFDEIARLAAGGLPRRDVLKLGLGGLGFAGLGLFDATPALADTCSCNGKNYDPNNQCCTPSGVQPLYPISNLSNCPNRAPNHYYKPSYNQCFDLETPNRFGRAHFDGCCSDHGNCYGTCLVDQDACDSKLLSCLQSECQDQYQGAAFAVLLSFCLKTAAAVAEDNEGTFVYNNMQETVCNCCQTPDRPPVGIGYCCSAKQIPCPLTNNSGCCPADFPVCCQVGAGAYECCGEGKCVPKGNYSYCNS